MIRLPTINAVIEKESSFEKCMRERCNRLWEWAKLSLTDCIRIYDQDVVGYPLAIECYAGRFSVQYFSPTRNQSEPTAEFSQEVTRALCRVFKIQPDSIYWRTHIKSKTTRQYEKIGESKEWFVAKECGLIFRINLVDYLDTGLFLDHRETRRMVGSISKGKKVLNLFAYTCSFSIHAAAGGALFTKSVDLSNTYTDWGKENFRLNSLPLKNNVVIRADCLKFLESEVRSGEKYDIIIIDPPTISRSKKMDKMFDIQKDYIFLVSKCLQLLSNKGVIFFSTNSRKFTFDADYFPSCLIEEISDQTIPIDFIDTKIHRCWKIQLR